MLFAEFDVAVLNKRLERADAGVLILGGVDLHNREVFPGLGCLLPHDLREVRLELHCLHAEAVVGPVVFPLEPPVGLQHVLNDLVRVSLGHVSDDHVDAAGESVLRQSEDTAGVRPLVLAQARVVGSHKQKPGVREVGRGLAFVVPVVEPLLLKGTARRVDGIVLDF